MLIGVLFGYLIVCSIVSLIVAGLMSLSVKLVVKKLPPFKTVFWISFFSTTIAIIVGNVLGGVRGANAAGSPLDLLPALLWFVFCWLLISNNISDTEAKIIGYGKGIAVTFIQSAFLGVMGVLFVLSVMMLMKFVHGS